MRTIIIEIANVNIKTTVKYYRTYAMCKDFISNKSPDIEITITQDDLDYEFSEYNKTGYMEPTLIQLEVISLFRKITEALIDYNILLIHGAAIAVNGYGFLFSGPSGIGKTTHIKKWLSNCPDSYVINGDKPFILFSDNGLSPLVCGSPWSGKENMYTNTKLPLKSIIMMERSEDNLIKQVSLTDIFPHLYQQIFRPKDIIKMRKTLELVKRLELDVKSWRFQFNNFKEDSFNIAYNSLVSA